MEFSGYGRYFRRNMTRALLWPLMGFLFGVVSLALHAGQNPVVVENSKPGTTAGDHLLRHRQSCAILRDRDLPHGLVWGDRRAPHV